MILVLEISPKYLPRRKELMLAFRRGLKLVSGRTAFGDASRTDAESVPRRFLLSNNHKLIEQMNKKTIITIFLSTTILLLVLCACSSDDITDTYWRDDKTGEWLIGVTENSVIYDCKVWGFSKMEENDGTYSLRARHGVDSLDINFGSEQDGKRTITIGGKQHDCSLIDSGWYLPDYPKKDTCDTIANNNYHAGDSVTIIGWVRPLPAVINWLKNKAKGEEGSSNEVVVKMMANILTDEEPSFTAPIDSYGHFRLQIPIENTTSFFLDCSGRLVEVVAEPNETYFLLIDPVGKKKLFMGKNAHLQNEVNAHYISPEGYGMEKLREIGDVMAILDTVRTQTKGKMQELDSVCKAHSTLSERYRTYYWNRLLTEFARILTQGMYLAPNNKVPEEYSKVVEEEYWKALVEPYTMDAYTFTWFFKDYAFRLNNAAQDKIDFSMKWIMDQAEKDGIVNLSAKDREAIRQYEEAYPAYWEKRQNAADSVQEKAIDDEFGKNDFVKAAIAIQDRSPKYKDYSRQKFRKRELEQIVLEMNERKWSATAQDIMLCRLLIQDIDWTRKPLSKEILAFSDEHIHLPAALHAVHTINDRYEQIGQSKFSNEDNIKSNDGVKDMSDGEKILRKIIEPYKGKIILVDVWGTWCAPCKMRLSHSQEEYERLKDFDIVYLYLCNRSSDESWKNVIKEYRIEGDNVVHYNLPERQQAAVEHFIGVNGYPTYKLIDRDGTLLDVNADPIDLDALVSLLEQMK